MLLNSLSAFEHAVAICSAMDTTPAVAISADIEGAANDAMYGANMNPISEEFDVNDRLYNTSPIIFDHNDTYTVDDQFLGSSQTRASELNESNIPRENFTAPSAESLFRPVAIPKGIGPYRYQQPPADAIDERKKIVENANAALLASTRNKDMPVQQEAGEAADEANAQDDSTKQSVEDLSLIRGDNTAKTQSPEFDPATPITADASDSNRPLVLSALTQLLEKSNMQSQQGNANEKKAMMETRADDGIALTIYLPDGNAMNITTGKTCDFKEVIVQTLNAHKLQGRRPALNYSNPSDYEIRLHEGDGEPDRDFPALELTKRVVDFNFDEYCLCTIKGRGGAGGNESSAVNIQPASFTGASFTMLEALAVTGVGGSSPQNGSNQTGTAGGNAGRGAGVRFDIEEDDRVRMRNARYESFDLVATPSSRNSTPSMNGMPVSSDYSDSVDHALERLMDNVVYIIFPMGERLDVFFEPEMKMIELIPLISGTQRLRLYTDEYIFKVSEADRRRLKLMSPIIDMNACVSDIGTFTFEIHKKVYADEGKRSQKTTTGNVPHHAKRKTSTDQDRILFTDASANAYQEWNVVKKNKFGRRQERVFGVDGKMVYNAKRGQSVRSGSASGSSGVQRAMRQIDSIVNIDTLHNDPKTFRITWMSERDIHNIEYTCEATRDCYEIVQKIKYILRRNLPKK